MPPRDPRADGQQECWPFAAAGKRGGHTTRVRHGIEERCIRRAAKPGEALADASLWADENRGRLPKTAPWHYIDVPLDEPKYDSKFSADVSSKGCVVDKINEFRLTMRDKSKSIEERRFALRFLIHWIEDLHMPLHVGDNKDKGGNLTQVRWFDRGSNMHRVWDSDIIERVSNREDSWLADLAALDTPETRAAAMKGTVEDWATERLLAARQAYQVPETGQRLKPGQKLGNAYVEAIMPVARKRLLQGGIRLAMVLNEAFPES